MGRLGTPHGGFKGWVRGQGLRPEEPASPEEEREITLYIQALMKNFIPSVGLMLVFIFGIWALLDLVALPAIDYDASALLYGHLLVAAVGLGFFLVPKTPLIHHPHLTWTAGFILVGVIAGVGVASMGDHGDRYFHFLYWIPMGGLGLLARFPVRMLSTILIGLSGQISYLAYRWGEISIGYLPTAITTMSAFIGTYILIGTMIDNILRWNSLYRLRDLERNQELQELVDAQTQELRELGVHLEEVREAERQWTAREVHDSLGQELMAVRLAVGLLRRQAGAEGPQSQFDYLESIIERSQQTLRGIVRRLRPPQLSQVGFVPAVRFLAQEMEHPTQLAFEVTFDPPDLEPPEAKATVLYRALQEALTNVVRHATDAQEVQIRLLAQEEDYLLEVHDDGSGPEPDAPSKSTHLGLIGIRERARSFGGDASWGVDEGGFLLRVRIPL